MSLMFGLVSSVRCVKQMTWELCVAVGRYDLWWPIRHHSSWSSSFVHNSSFWLSMILGVSLLFLFLCLVHPQFLVCLVSPQFLVYLVYPQFVSLKPFIHSYWLSFFLFFLTFLNMPPFFLLFWIRFLPHFFFCLTATNFIVAEFDP